MRDLRRAFNIAWAQAENSQGDFKDFLLHYLSCNLGMPILNEVRTESTNEGIEEMCRGVKPNEVESNDETLS